MGLERVGSNGMSGSSGKAQPTSPSDPESGSYWLDTSFDDPAFKVYDGEKFVVVSEGTNIVESRVEYTSPHGSSPYTYDTSKINKVVELKCVGGVGDSPSGYYETVSGSKGGVSVFQVDLVQFSQLKIELYSPPTNSDGPETLQAGAGCRIYGDNTYLGGSGGGGSGAYDQAGTSSKNYLLTARESCRSRRA